MELIHIISILHIENNQREKLHGHSLRKAKDTTIIQNSYKNVHHYERTEISTECFERLSNLRTMGLEGIFYIKSRKSRKYHRTKAILEL